MEYVVRERRAHLLKDNMKDTCDDGTILHVDWAGGYTNAC